MSTIRYRWEQSEAAAPRVGYYLLSPKRPRHGFLIHKVDNRGRRGGLGVPVHILLVLTVERVSVDEARAAGDRCYPITWDTRGKRR